MHDAMQQTGYRVTLEFVSLTRCGGDRQTYMATPPLPVAVPVTDGTVTLLGGSAGAARNELTAQSPGDGFGVKYVENKMTIEETHSSNNKSVGPLLTRPRDAGRQRLRPMMKWRITCCGQ